MEMKMESSIWIVILLSILSVVACVEKKCPACKAVADELEVQLLKEKPRNHLDMRNRLNSKGQREGKVIDYRVSELRAIELLDGLCDRMEDYTLETLSSKRQLWVKVDSFDKLPNKQEALAHAKDISSYCGRLLEENEDELAEFIKKGSLRVGQVSKVLCQDLSKHCSKSSGDSLDDEDTNEENEEL